MQNDQRPSPAVAKGHPVIVFDGECVLCSASAQFVLRHDRRGYFRLATMQGPVGAELFVREGISPSDPQTLIVVQADKVLRDSSAILAICSGLGWPWRALGFFRAVPSPVRDWAYRLIARNRYRWFGRREVCWLPQPEYADRVL